MFGPVMLAQALLAQAILGAAVTVTLPTATPVTLETVTLLSSEVNRRGDPVALRTVDDVIVGDAIVIPKGTVATGQVTLAERKGGFGAAGTLGFELLYLKVDGQVIRLRGDSETRGRSNSTRAALSNVIVTAAAVAITGRRAEIAPGTRVTGYSVRAVTLTIAR
jgi:hypothetical protein